MKETMKRKTSVGKSFATEGDLLEYMGTPVKNWDVRLWTSTYSVPINIVITLGLKSDKNDVKEELKRQGLKGEVLSITERRTE